MNAMQVELFRTGSMASASCSACMSAEDSLSQEAVKADYDNPSALMTAMAAFRHRCAHLLQPCDYQGKKLPPAEVENRLGVQQMVHWLDFLRLAFLLLQQSDRALQALHGFMQYDDERPDLFDPVTDHVSTL